MKKISDNIKHRWYLRRRIMLQAFLDFSTRPNPGETDLLSRFMRSPPFMVRQYCRCPTETVHRAIQRWLMADFQGMQAERGMNWVLRWNDRENLHILHHYARYGRMSKINRIAYILVRKPTVRFKPGYRRLPPVQNVYQPCNTIAGSEETSPRQAAV